MSPHRSSPSPMDAASTGAAPDAGAPEGAPGQATPRASEPPTFAIGAAVQLARSVPYLRSADPMPMLRPPDLVDRQEIGTVMELRALGRVAVRFRRGSFLVDAADLEAVSDS
ncbi:MAG: NAD(P)H dehydrogenase assembly family protein [Synechococcaceae cyanobacterium]|nr:NAD(P)H dehydrogenase assembly family protein [Synechococcaceae cyanobacterium]